MSITIAVFVFAMITAAILIGWWSRVIGEVRRILARNRANAIIEEELAREAMRAELYNSATYLSENFVPNTTFKGRL